MTEILDFLDPIIGAEGSFGSDTESGVFLEEGYEGDLLCRERYISPGSITILKVYGNPVDEISEEDIEFKEIDGEKVRYVQNSPIEYQVISEEEKEEVENLFSEEYDTVRFPEEFYNDLDEVIEDE